MKILVLISSIFLFWTQALHAAPFPRAVPSATIEPELGVFTHKQAGFKVAAQNTGWILDQAPKGAQGMDALFHAPSSSDQERGLLTIRVDKDIQTPTLNAYMEKWNQEYPRYGFDVLGTRAFELNGQTGYVVDLVNRDRNRQMRQVIYHKDKIAVILSCRDNMKNFENTLKSCNTIMKSFAWIEPESNPSQTPSETNQ